MHPIIQFILTFIGHYRYTTLFSVALFEGAASTIAAGVFISLGHLSFWPTLGIILAGDLVADSTLYLLGRFGRTITRRIPFLKITEHHLETIERHFGNHPFRTLAIGKVSYGLSGAFLVAAGGAKLSYKKFIPRVAVLDTGKASLLLGIGWYFGRKALGIRRFLPYYTIAIFIIILLAYYFLRYRKTNNEQKKNITDH